MRIALRGRRSCLLWLLAWLCVLGVVGAAALTAVAGAPVGAALRARWFAAQTADVAQVVEHYREAERAALLTLDDNVLAQAPVFAQGEALDDLTRRVQALRAGGRYQRLETESFAIVQVIAADPYVLVTAHEVTATETVPLVAGDAPAERSTASAQVVYQLAHDAERWKVAKVEVVYD